MADGRVGHEELAVEIGRPDVAGVGEDEAADAGGGEVVGDHAAETADAADEDGGRLEAGLGGFTEPLDIELPGVGVTFGLREGLPWRRRGVGRDGVRRFHSRD